MNKYLYVVEGKTDVAKLKNLGAKYVIKTDGFNVNKNEIVEYLKYAIKTRDIVLIFDPDGPGNRIKSIILKGLESSKDKDRIHEINVSKKEAIAHKKVGIAQMKTDDLLKYLEIYLNEDSASDEKTIYNNDILIELKLAGSNAKENREKLKKFFSVINISNSKTLINDLEILKINLDTVRKIINEKN